MTASGPARPDYSGGPPRVIAEIGTSHGGEISRARELIRAAAEAGAHVAKFQAIIAEEIVHPRSGKIELPGGSVPIYDRFRELEQPPDFYASLREECLSAGIGFLCTPFGIRSAEILSELQLREWKIASPELNHLPLLTYIGKTGLPVILSSGVSTLGDIELAIETLRNEGPRELTLLHCVTSYPAPAEEYNLRLLPHLSALFGVEVGVSDHSEDPELVPGLGVLMGAHLIEKHLTLSRKNGGLDDPIALEPQELRRCAGVVESVWQLLRAGATQEAVLREFYATYGEERVQSVLGNGQKALAPSETANYRTTNRSIVLREDTPAGTILAQPHLAILRSEHNLTPGLHPRFLQTVLGSTLRQELPAGAGLTWEHLIEKGGAR